MVLRRFDRYFNYMRAFRKDAGLRRLTLWCGSDKLQYNQVEYEIPNQDHRSDFSTLHTCGTLVFRAISPTNGVQGKIEGKILSQN